MEKGSSIRWIAIFAPGKGTSSSSLGETEARFVKSELLHEEMFEEDMNDQREEFLRAEVAQSEGEISRNEQFEDSIAAIDKVFTENEMKRESIFAEAEVRREDVSQAKETNRDRNFNQREVIREEIFAKAQGIQRERAAWYADRREQHVTQRSRDIAENCHKLEKEMSAQFDALVHFLSQSFGSEERKRNDIVEKMLAEKIQVSETSEQDSDVTTKPDVELDRQSNDDDEIGPFAPQVPMREESERRPPPVRLGIAPQIEREQLEDTAEYDYPRHELERPTPLPPPQHHIISNIEGSEEERDDGAGLEPEKAPNHDSDLESGIRNQPRPIAFPQFEYSSDNGNLHYLHNGWMTPILPESSNEDKDSREHVRNFEEQVGVEGRIRHPSTVFSNSYEKVKYESLSMQGKSVLRDVATLPYTQTTSPQPDAYQTRFEKAEKRREETFKQDEADRDASFEQAEAERDESERKRQARFEEDTRIRDEVYSAAKGHRDSSYEQAELGRGNREQWRELQFDDAQERRASLFQQSQLWDEKQYTTLDIYQNEYLEYCKARVESLYETQQELLAQARRGRSEAFSRSHLRYGEQLGVKLIWFPISRRRSPNYYPVHSEGLFLRSSRSSRLSRSRSRSYGRSPRRRQSTYADNGGFDPSTLLVRPHMFSPLPVPGDRHVESKKSFDKDFTTSQRRRQYLFKKRQTDRAQKFEQGMERRQRIFNIRERQRQKVFAKDQTERKLTAAIEERGRAKKFTEEEKKREKDFRDKELKREADFQAAERRRGQSFRAAQIDRDRLFYEQQAMLQAKCIKSEGSRRTRFNKWERDWRNNLEQRDQKVRTGFEEEESKRANIFAKLIHVAKSLGPRQIHVNSYMFE